MVNWKLLILFFLMILQFTQQVTAQKTIEDSLLITAKNAPNDSLEAATYFQLAKANRRVNPEKHLEYSRKFLRAAKSYGNAKQQGIALSELGTYFQRNDEYDSSYYYYKQAIPFFESEKNIANAYSRLSNIEKARGNYVESVELLIKADSLFEQAGFKKGRLVTNTNLGIILSLQKEFEPALKYFQRAERFLEKDDKKQQSALYTNFAITYNELGNLKKSKDYNLKSLEIKQELNDSFGMANAYGNLASLALQEKDTTLAITQYLNAEKAYQKSNSKNGLSNTYNSLGSIYRLQGNMDQSRNYLNAANTLALEIGNHAAIVNSEKSLYLLNKDLGRWQSAFRHLENYKGLQDSLFEVEKMEITRRLQTEFETERIQQEKEIAETNEILAKEKAKNNRNFAIGVALISGLALISLLFLLYRFRARKKQEVLELKLVEKEKHLVLEQQTRIAELKALQSQMNPHFLFNTLNSIQDLILLQDVRNSNKYLVKFSNLLRDVLSASKKGWINLDNEIEMLRNYAELELLRFEDSLEFTIQSDVPDFIASQAKVPAMFIQPYIENALKHGLLHKTGKKVLKVHFQEKYDGIECTIIDNGIGRAAAGMRSHSNGLQFSTQANVERVQLINAQIEQNINVSTEDLYEGDQSSGTKVVLQFPILTKSPV